MVPLFMEFVSLKMAQSIAKRKETPICAPVPTAIDKNIGEKDGGRKTSPWTNFHPDSSWASSIVWSSLYPAISFRSVRIMIVAIAPVMNKTIIREFTIE